MSLSAIDDRPTVRSMRRNVRCAQSRLRIAFCVNVLALAVILAFLSHPIVDTRESQVLVAFAQLGISCFSLIICLMIIIPVFDRYFSSRRKKWWDPSDEMPDGDIKWNHVLDMVRFDFQVDPLKNRFEERSKIDWISITAVLFLCMVLSIVEGNLLETTWTLTISPLFVVFVRCVVWCLFKSAASENLTAYLAIIAAAVSIIFTFVQLRARVRAENRSKWISHIRSLIAKAIALSCSYANARSRRRQEIWLELDIVRMELELMLNPSEKDHRLLMYLIQRIAILDNEDGKQDDIQDAQIVRRFISDEDGANSHEWGNILNTSSHSEIISYILRLSHVVLKREWERVKHTR